ncbi:master DNA invertase Mpi family serine-type recombinase [Weissella cibaria]|uniref:master DNA invertase Mpi family serine-type recombinase n=1 Tax=Weissella cibaria TaxID=137591 RepID=UPI0011903074|nr:master DNA invertase Mpi family serine-type recombinase [Weissella cibaria]MDK9678818.1 master DNA invertase Mpi family serine-type recombinase [Weissella cibaria]TVV38369.1 master DNA invertase Mpi family serine-type recombinase [Weissella cibaria]
MIYGYIRVSTEKQSLKNQKFEIKEFCASRSFVVDKWVSETISSTKKLSERKLSYLMKKVKKGDVIIVSEISRLGRNLLQIMSILNYCMEKEVKIFTVKEGYELGNNINSKVLAFAFGLSAEIERTLISQRTKEALARKKAEGVKLGRPVGRSRIEKLKLYTYRNEIESLLTEGWSYARIARKYKVNRITVGNFVKRLIEHREPKE